MDTIQWSEEFSVGSEVLDNQHKRIITMMNELILSDSKEFESEKISEILTEMRQYADEHFSYEEQVMSEYKYHRLEAHKKLHKSFRLKAAQLCGDVLNEDSQIYDKTVEYLFDWLVKHILNADKDYSKCFKQDLGAV